MPDSKQYDFSGYNTVCKMREGLQDNDPLTAYKVFTQAGIVQSYLESIWNETLKDKSDQEVQMQAVESEVSIEKSPDKPTDGNRKAKADPRVVAEKMEFNRLTASVNKLASMIKYMEKCYYDAKLIYTQCHEKQIRGGNM